MKTPKLKLTDQHRAILITLLISGTIILMVFNLSLKQHETLASESYYVMEPEEEPTLEELKILEALEQLNNSKAETNSAFNETQESSKRFDQAFKQIAPPEDYVPKSTDQGESDPSEENNFEQEQDASIEKEELSKFNKVQELLKKQNSDNNSKSTIWFSLHNRNKIHIPIPIYLCETDGKIVVNITVNSNGDVTETDINTSSTSDNKCLIERALEYAKESRFSISPYQESQIGTITFLFMGKR